MDTMDQLARFYDLIKKEMTVLLSTAAGNSVTMRRVSPVLYEGSVLIFTAPDSQKYRQLTENPHCCIAAGDFFAEATATLLGATMSQSNQALREAYAAKFPGAFDQGIAFGGRNAAFVLLKPVKISGWAYENDMPNPEGIPTIPFAFTVEEPRR